MSYKKVKSFIYQLRFLQEQDLDVLCICSSPKGFGKSSFIISRNRCRIDVLEGTFTKSDSKKLKGCYYSSNEKAWVFPVNKENLQIFEMNFISGEDNI